LHVNQAWRIVTILLTFGLLPHLAELVDMDFKQRGQRLPSPAKIITVKLLGRGWDFAAAVDNIELLAKP